MLTSQQKERYQKQLLLPEIGEAGQQKLLAARVLVVGLGGLGCPVVAYLAGAGVGTLGLVDADVVALSNLQRQVLYGIDDIGQKKVEVAQKRLNQLNNSMIIEVFPVMFQQENADELLRNFDFVIDCTDNFSVRYAINDTCVRAGKPFVYGAIHRFEGQVSVFNYCDAHGNWGPTYRCLFPEQPSGLAIPNCAEIGVLGALPGVIGTLQAVEALKIITGIGHVLSGELVVMDLLENIHRKMRFYRRKDAEMLAQTKPFSTEISVEHLRDELVKNPDIFLLDVRNPEEYAVCHLPGSLLAPMHEIEAFIEKIPTDRPVVVYCHFGIRSANVIAYLSGNHQFTNLTNLSEGIHAWAKRIDTTMPTY